MRKIILSIFRGKREAESERRIEPLLCFGPSKHAVHRRCSCIVSDEFPDPSRKPIFTISPGDTKEDIARGIAEFLRQLQIVPGGFRRYDEDLSWLEQAEKPRER